MCNRISKSEKEIRLSVYSICALFSSAQQLNRSSSREDHLHSEYALPTILYSITVLLIESIRPKRGREKK